MKLIQVLTMLLSSTIITSSIIGSDQEKKESAAQQQTKFEVFGNQEVNLSNLGEIRRVNFASNGGNFATIEYVADFPDDLQLNATTFLHNSTIECLVISPGFNSRYEPDKDGYMILIPGRGPLSAKLPDSVFATMEAMYKMQEEKKAAEKKSTEKK